MEVAVPVPGVDLLTYSVPEELDLPRPGCRVLVPVGRRTMTGVVIRTGSPDGPGASAPAALPHAAGRAPGVGDIGNPSPAIRDVSDVLDTEPFLPAAVVDLALWMADYYVCSPGEAVAAAMPALSWVESRRVVRLTVAGRESLAAHAAAARRASGDVNYMSILRSLEDGRPRSIRQVASAAARVRAEVSVGDVPAGPIPVASVIASLERRGLVESAQVVRGSADRHKTVAWAALTVEGQNLLASGGVGSAGPRQQEALALLGGLPYGLPLSSLRKRGVDADSLRRLARRGLVSLRRERVERDPFAESGGAASHTLAPPTSDLGRVLSQDQSSAMERLVALAAGGRFRAALLHGVTGSGKTEIYLRLASFVRDRGKQSLVLVPEIALTPALAAAFRASFGGRVAILHSGLSDGERYDQWQRVRRGEVDVAVGTRSAVFAPLSSVGLIVVDEEHDGSYKQEESPRYNGRDVAVMRAKREEALVVLGSATPSVETFLNAVKGRYEMLSLERRVMDRPLASVSLVNMRDEIAERGPDTIFSDALRSAIEARLARSEQVLVLLNRRGFATALFCRQCGGTIDCPNCSVSLTIHGAGRNRRGRCHYCNHQAPVPAACPRCAAPYLEQVGAGTQRIEAEAARLFPGARLARLDRDVLRRRGAAAALLARFARREIDILVGTQMIAKGHDFPAVTLVGVISADVGLGLPDFRAAERTFQLLTQVVGRAGRGERAGEAIIQTIHPDHYSVRHACRQDYRAFFDEEIGYRRALRYPPIVALANVLVRGSTLQEAMERAATLAGALREHAPRGRDMRVVGPAPAPLSRLKGETRVHFFVKSPWRADLRAALRSALDACPNIRRHASVDVDPLSVL
ncbi:MAG: primosomal protein N' [Vicinamibacterales bacterium]